MKKRCQGYFCSNPFENAIIDEHGDVFLCCQSWLSLPIGNLLDSSWNDIWNGPVARSIRQSIHDGSYVYCSELNCPYLQGQPGRFKAVDQVADPYFRAVIEERRTDLERGPTTVTISYDPTCNLACPSCRCGYIVAKGKDFDRAKIIHDKVWASALDDCTCLYITGMGDPFSSRLYRQILRDFDPARFPDMGIALITNGLLLTPGMWESIRASHGAIDSVNVSINACSPETFAVNQEGGSWEKLLENLAFMKSLRASGAIGFLGFGFFVHENNFHEMADFVRLGKAYDVDMVTFANMQNWGTYSDEEFARIAVHLPPHPRHQEFLGMLKDPIFLDPLCRMGNISSFVPGLAPAAAGESPVAAAGPVSMDEFSRWLMLDEAQRETARKVADHLKTEMTETLAAPPADGGPAPVDLLAGMLREGRENGDAALQEYLATASHPQANKPYLHVLHDIDVRGKESLKRLLTRYQSAAWDLAYDRPLAELDTGFDPLGERVHARIGETPATPDAAPAPEREPARPGSWDEWRRWLEGAGIDQDRFLATLRTFRDRLADLYDRAPAPDKPAPAEVLAQRLKERDPRAQAEFVAYISREKDPESGRTYLRASRDIESETRRRLGESLKEGGRSRLEAVLPKSLLDIAIGHDPLGEVVKARMRRTAARHH